jgi:hypothetical protein
LHKQIVIQCLLLRQNQQHTVIAHTYIVQLIQQILIKLSHFMLTVYQMYKVCKVYKINKIKLNF